MAEENKDNKTGTTNVSLNNKDTEVVQLTMKEMSDIRGLIAKSAEKDLLIENLTQKSVALEAEVAKVQAGQGAMAQKSVGERKITQWYGRLRKYDDKWVLGWTKEGVYRETNARGEKEEFINVIVKGIDKPVKMRFLDYINDLPQETVKIKEKRKLADLVENQGEVERMVFDEKSGVMIGLGFSVPIEVTTEKFNYVFDLNGEDVEINSEFVNR